MLGGAVVAKFKASVAGDGATLYFWGMETSPTMFWVILGAAVLVGVLMIVVGLKGVLGKSS